MKRKIYLYWGNDEKYEVGPDAVVAEEFSETLNSASVLLPSVKSGRGIVLGGKPYDEVYLSVELDDGTEEYSEWFLIDSIDSVQVSYTGDENYFDVTLELMSETKYLEKKQLPNVSVTHSLSKGQKTLYEAISYYLETYSQEYTGEGSRKALISLDGGANWNMFKSAKCADVMMSKPTLRQCLTTLMSQVGCIPVVRHRKLSYLNLGAKRGFFLPPSEGSVRRSASSDSWVNSLITESSQCVDKDSECVVESLCFRDKDGVLLRQTQNLKLETRYPIYSVKKLTMNAYVKGTANFNVLRGGAGIFSGIGGLGTNSVPASLHGALIVVYSGSKLQIIPWCQETTGVLSASGTRRFHQVLASVNEDGSLSQKKTLDNSAAVSFSNAKQSDPSTWSAVSADTFPDSDYSGNEVTLISMRFDGAITVNGVAWEPQEINPNFGFLTDSAAGTSATHDSYKNYFSAFDYNQGAWEGQKCPVGYYKKSPAGQEYGFYTSQDITPLCVEASKRAQLDADFLSMPAWGSIEEMSKYVYATVGYSIGGSEISGFSSTYTQSKGWWDETKTYIENIVDSTGMSRQGVNAFYGGAIPQEYLVYMFDNQQIANPFFNERHNMFSVMFFDVEYVPLIQAKAAYEKEDAPLALEQLDSAESGVSDMDSVSALEEQKADRLGNPVWSMHIRVPRLQGLPSLNSAWGDRVAFKRTLKLGANAIDAEYTFSKDYVLRNYFTSITTKYRAYEYVDYSQSIERKELVKAYIRLCPKDGGNAKNVFPASQTFALAQNARGFINSLEGRQNASKRLTGAGYYLGKYDVENELSAVCTGSKCVLTAKEYDNVSDGPYVDGTYLKSDGDYYSDPLGGIPQRWYESRGAEVPRIIFHTTGKKLRPEAWGSDADAYVSEHVRDVQKYPRYYYEGNFVTNDDYDDYFFMELPFAEKDASELLSASLQVEACWCAESGSAFNDKTSAKFSKWLYRMSSLLGGYPSEKAHLGFRATTSGQFWNPGKKSSAGFSEIDSLLIWGVVEDKPGYEVNAQALAQNAETDIEVAVVDGDDAYPLAWFKKGALRASLLMTCVPGKSDKTLAESAGKSVLYETY